MRSLLVSLVVLAVPAAALATTQTPYQASSEQQVLSMLNQIREQHGLPDLALSAPLRAAARGHSADMLQHGYFGHDSPTESWSARVSSYLKSSLMGENIASGRGPSGSPAGIVSQWMHSAPHRRLILTPGFRVVGIGIAEGTFGGTRGAVLATADFAA